MASQQATALVTSILAPRLLSLPHVRHGLPGLSRQLLPVFSPRLPPCSQLPAFFRQSTEKVVAADEQKAAVLERVRAYAKRSAALLNEESDGPVSLFVTLHGAAEAAVDSICSYGAKDLR